MKIWYLTAALALVCAAYVVRDLVQNPGDPLSPDGFGGLVGFVAMAVVTVFLFRRHATNTRFDDNGPVTPAEDPAIPDGTRWTVEQIAAVLALHVQPMNGVVFADERTQTIRVMIDPPSAITWSAGKTEQTNFTHSQQERWQRQGGRSTSPASYAGSWTRIQLHPGQLPQLENRTSTVSVKINDTGMLVPDWARGGDSGSGGPGALTSAGSRTPISFEFDSRELQHAVDRIAIRAGWVSEQQVAARPADPKTRHEVRTVERTASKSTSSSSLMAGDQPSSEELRARLEKARAQQAKGPRRQVDAAKIMTLVGAAVLAGCVIGTVLGLIFGMPWWASFIIIGSGLVFCAVFVLPVRLLMGGPRRPEQA